MTSLTDTMRGALERLARADAELRGRDVWRQTYKLPGGTVIPAQTLSALARRGLGRSIGPFGQRFTLTSAGRQLAAAIQSGTHS